MIELIFLMNSWWNSSNSLENDNWKLSTADELLNSWLLTFAVVEVIDNLMMNCAICPHLRSGRFDDSFHVKQRTLAVLFSDCGIADGQKQWADHCTKPSGKTRKISQANPVDDLLTLFTVDPLSAKFNCQNQHCTIRIAL